MNKPSSIFVGSLGRDVWVKVEGRGTFQNSPGVKEFVKRMIDRGQRNFIVDLGKCELMDSTFMGTLAGIALRLREIGEGGLHAINVNDRNGSLLESLGLDQLFSVDSGSGNFAPPELKQAAAAGTADAKNVVLSAHEALVEADAANAVKFKDVIEYLRQELEETGEAED